MKYVVKNTIVKSVQKKICFISTIDMTLRHFVIPSARELKKHGFDVYLMASMNENFEHEFKSEFHLINIPMGRGADFFSMIRSLYSFYQVFKKEEFSIIQYATPNAAFYASVAGYLTRVPARVYNQWGIRYVGFLGIHRFVFKMIEKTTCILSTHIRPASRKNRDFAIKENLYKPIKSKVIGDGGAVGIDLKTFNYNLRSKFRDEILIIHQEIKNKKVFGFIGRLEKDKGVNELIEAFKIIHSSYKNYFLLIIGPNDKNQGLKPELMKFASTCSHVIFTGYSLDVKKYLCAIDILVHPSYREGFSLVIQQAMAMGTPVITTNIPGPSEVIEENISGILVPVKNSSSLARAMFDLANDEQRKKYFAKNGIERVRHLFSQERISNLIVEDRQEIFNSLCL